MAGRGPHTNAVSSSAGTCRLIGSVISATTTAAVAIRRARADRAAALMVRGRDVAELALGAGYADQIHMTREFGLLYGLTPARYRALFA